VSAALELLAQDGYRALTMERVRERAGVGKATLYRRYSSKDELVRAAIGQLNADVPLPDDQGSLVADFAAVARAVLAGGGLNLMPRLLADVARDPEMHALFSEHLVAPRRRVVRALLERGVTRGEVRADADLDLATDMIIGPVVYRVILAGGDPARLGEPAEIVRAALAGLSPR
jgi:AcrR family transcriptional regulator